MNSAEGGGGGSDLELSSTAAASIAGAHEKAAGRVTALAGSVPNLDAGYGGTALADILAKVLVTADTLATVNQAAADQVRAVANHLGGTDSEVAAAFSELSGNSWPFGGTDPGQGASNPFLPPGSPGGFR